MDGQGQGLILGKFLPPHAGHVHLVETARAQVERLDVLVCSLRREPIDGALRHRWMSELFPDVRVVHVDDELPQEPSEDPEFWPKWLATIDRVAARRPDVVFTSEDYGDELARRLGARHISVDRERARFPISGTQVRADPLAAWEFLPAPVRAHFVKRVLVYGSESTGKTTLSARLAAEFDTVWVPEFARAYFEHRTRVEAEDFGPIVHGQIADEDRLARLANRVLICDTDPLTTSVYAEAYTGACPEWIRAAARARRYDLVLFCDIDVPWVDEHLRDFGHNRPEMHARFAAALAGVRAPVVPVRGSWDERFAAARAAVAALLG